MVSPQVRHMTTRQLTRLHNDNDKVIELMGADLAGNKQLLRNMIKNRKL